MIVILLEKVSPSLRGELSRWLLEPKTGVFVGRVSALVRDKLWQKCVDVIGPTSGGLLIHRDDNEQGFTLRTAAAPSREIVDYEGLLLVRIPHDDPEKARRKMRLGRKKDLPQTENLPFVRDRVISPLMSPLPDAPAAEAGPDESAGAEGPAAGDEEAAEGPPPPAGPGPEVGWGETPQSPEDAARKVDRPFDNQDDSVFSEVGQPSSAACPPKAPGSHSEGRMESSFFDNPRASDFDGNRQASGVQSTTPEEAPIEDEEFLDVPLWWSVRKKSEPPAASS